MSFFSAGVDANKTYLDAPAEDENAEFPNPFWDDAFRVAPETKNEAGKGPSSDSDAQVAKNASRAGELILRGTSLNPSDPGQSKEIEEMMAQAARKGPEHVSRLVEAINQELARRGSDLRLDHKTGSESRFYEENVGNKTVVPPVMEVNVPVVELTLKRGDVTESTRKVADVPYPYSNSEKYFPTSKRQLFIDFGDSIKG